MASDVTASTETSVQTAPAPQPPQPEPRLRPYRGRFVAVYVGLAVILAAGAVGLVFALGGASVGSDEPAWSAWKPAASSDSARAREIADYVSKGYRLLNGDQLVDVIVKAPMVRNVPVRAVAVRAQGGGYDQVDEIDSGNSLVFQLCGLGQACAIGTGRPTIERGRLVRREVLELALYTFKYADNFNHLIAFMPPKKGSQPELALYFTRGDLGNELDRPLVETLNTRAPRQDAITPRETATIDRLTEPHIFKFQFQPTQLGDAVLVLDPAL